MKICTYPDPMLKKQAEPVVNIDDEIQNLIDNMGKVMYEASGIGLAANQVGVPKRVIIFDINYREKGKDLNVLINPTIVLAEDKIEFEEGCLSVPDFQDKIIRKKYLKVKGVDRHGKPIDIEAEDLVAICIVLAPVDCIAVNRNDYIDRIIDKLASIRIVTSLNTVTVSILTVPSMTIVLVGVIRSDSFLEESTADLGGAVRHLRKEVVCREACEVDRT